MTTAIPHKKTMVILDTALLQQGSKRPGHKRSGIGDIDAIFVSASRFRSGKHFPVDSQQRRFHDRPLACSCRPFKDCLFATGIKQQEPLLRFDAPDPAREGARRMTHAKVAEALNAKGFKTSIGQD